MERERERERERETETETRERERDDITATPMDGLDSRNSTDGACRCCISIFSIRICSYPPAMPEDTFAVTCRWWYKRLATWDATKEDTRGVYWSEYPHVCTRGICRLIHHPDTDETFVVCATSGDFHACTSSGCKMAVQSDIMGQRTCPLTHLNLGPAMHTDSEQLFRDFGTIVGGTPVPVLIPCVDQWHVLVRTGYRRSLELDCWLRGASTSRGRHNPRRPSSIHPILQLPYDQDDSIPSGRFQYSPETATITGLLAMVPWQTIICPVLVLPGGDVPCPDDCNDIFRLYLNTWSCEPLILEVAEEPIDHGGSSSSSSSSGWDAYGETVVTPIHSQTSLQSCRRDATHRAVSSMHGLETPLALPRLSMAHTKKARTASLMATSQALATTSHEPRDRRAMAKALASAPAAFGQVVSSPYNTPCRVQDLTCHNLRDAFRGTVALLTSSDDAHRYLDAFEKQIAPFMLASTFHRREWDVHPLMQTMLSVPQPVSPPSIPLPTTTPDPDRLLPPRKHTRRSGTGTVSSTDTDTLMEELPGESLLLGSSLPSQVVLDERMSRKRRRQDSSVPCINVMCWRVARYTQVHLSQISKRYRRPRHHEFVHWSGNIFLQHATQKHILRRKNCHNNIRVHHTQLTYWTHRDDYLRHVSSYTQCNVRLEQEGQYSDTVKSLQRVCDAALSTWTTSVHSARDYINSAGYSFRLHAITCLYESIRPDSDDRVRFVAEEPLLRWILPWRSHLYYFGKEADLIDHGTMFIRSMVARVRQENMDARKREVMVNSFVSSIVQNASFAADRDTRPD